MLSAQMCFTGTTIDINGLESQLSESICATPIAIVTKPKPFIWKIFLRFSNN